MAIFQKYLAAPDMRSFLRWVYPHQQHWHAWCGYSNNTHTLDKGYFACDWYWQDPGMVYTGRYHWNVLLDVAEPVNWYLGVHVLIKGMRDMDEAELYMRDMLAPRYGKGKGIPLPQMPGQGSSMYEWPWL